MEHYRPSQLRTHNFRTDPNKWQNIMDTQNVDKKSSQEGSRGHNSSQSDLEIDVFKRDDDMDVKEPVDRALYGE